MHMADLVDGLIRKTEEFRNNFLGGQDLHTRNNQISAIIQRSSDPKETALKILDHAKTTVILAHTKTVRPTSGGLPGVQEEGRELH